MTVEARRMQRTRRPPSSRNPNPHHTIITVSFPAFLSPKPHLPFTPSPPHRHHHSHHNHHQRRRCPPATRRLSLRPPQRPTALFGNGKPIPNNATNQQTPPPTIDALVTSIQTFTPTPSKSTRADTITTLNTLSTLPENTSITPVYKALRNAARLPCFGLLAPPPPPPPLQQKAQLAANLAHHAQLPLSALTPRKANLLLLQLVVISSLSAFAYVSRQMNLLSVFRPTVYATLSVLTLDQIALRGAITDSMYTAINPRHARRVATHEAGHFLLAYLNGLPIQRYVLTARDAVAARIPGQAATLFADEEFSRQMGERRVTQRVIDRYCVVSMAGIAAEALVFGEAVGGDGDIAGVVALLQREIEPGWREDSVRVQARWAVLQAVLIIRRYFTAFEVLVEAMLARLSLGECVLRLEEALEGMGVAVSGEEVADEGLLQDIDRREATVEEELRKVEGEIQARGDS